MYCTLPWEPCTSDLKGEDQMPQRKDGLGSLISATVSTVQHGVCHESTLPVTVLLLEGATCFAFSDIFHLYLEP